MPLAAPVLLMVQTERPTASIMSGIVLKRLPHSGSFTLGIKSKLQGLMSGEYEGWYSTSHCHLASTWFTMSVTCGRALLCRIIGVFSPRMCGLFFRNARHRWCSKKSAQYWPVTVLCWGTACVRMMPALSQAKMAITLALLGFCRTLVLRGDP